MREAKKAKSRRAAALEVESLVIGSNEKNIFEKKRHKSPGRFHDDAIGEDGDFLPAEVAIHALLASRSGIQCRLLVQDERYHAIYH